MIDMRARCIDVHCYHGKWGFPIIEMTTADVLRMMEQARVEKAVLMSSRAIQYDLVAGNAELAEAIAPHPALYGYVYINMHYPDLSARELEKYLPSPKFAGVKYQGEYSRAAASAPENRDIFTLLEQVYRKPLLIHSWGLPEHGNAVAYSLPAQILELAQQHPELKVIMGHMGGTEWMDGIRAAQQAPNLYLDTCASYADRDKVGTAVRVLGADKVLFGSGATEGSLFMQKAAILDADLTETEKDVVLYGAAARVFGLQ
jgi:predicted TIM-barrel fold metal-dependent hydrolase